MLASWDFICLLWIASRCYFLVVSVLFHRESEAMYLFAVRNSKYVPRRIARQKDPLSIGRRAPPSSLRTMIPSMDRSLSTSRWDVTRGISPQRSNRASNSCCDSTIPRSRSGMVRVLPRRQAILAGSRLAAALLERRRDHPFFRC